MDVSFTGRPAIGPIRSGPWWVPVIVDRQATVSSSQMSWWTSKRRSGKAVRSVVITFLRWAVTAQRRNQMAQARTAATVCSKAKITGVAFFDFFHNQTGVAPNEIELPPILAFHCVTP
jgi:hypothetical protein